MKIHIIEQFHFFSQGHMLSFQIDPQPLESRDLLTLLFHAWHTYSEAPTSQCKLYGILSNTDIFNSRIGTKTNFTNSATTEKSNELWIQGPYYFNTFLFKKSASALHPKSSSLPSTESYKLPRGRVQLLWQFSHLINALNTRVSALWQQHTNLLLFAFFSQFSDVPTESSLLCDC